MRPFSHRVTEADQTFDEIRAAVCAAIEEAVAAGPDVYIWVRDLTEEWAVYEISGEGVDGGYQLFKRTYTRAEDGTITLTGDPTKVELTYAEVRESADRVRGRIIESRGADPNGGRVFRVQVIEAGLAKNRRLYPMRVLAAAVPLYDGAKAFDHHRTEEELRLGSTAGLVGQYRNPSVNERGIEADLHLLPSATAVAEALDASLAGQADGLKPLVGISHDVGINGNKVNDPSHGLVEEVTEIVHVFSADVVAEASAGGKALRAVAGGSGGALSEEDTHMTLKELLAALRAETDATKRAALLGENKSLLDEWGLDDAAVGRILAEETTDTGTEETAPPAPAGADGTQAPVAVGATQATEAAFARDSLMGGMLIERALEAAGLDVKLADKLREQLPERITEASVRAVIGSGQTFVRALEASGLRPAVEHIAVGGEDHDKKVERLYQTFCRNFQAGYSRFSEAYFDITGERPAVWESDLVAQVVRESWAPSRVSGARRTESISSTSFGEALGNTLHRRLIELYAGSSLQTWRKIVRVVPVNDFRTRELVVMGGYGPLDTVLEGAPYQPLTTPSDVENTYTPSKKGGIETITFETFKNDDIGVLPGIPERMARAAALTVHRFVFISLLSSNPNVVDVDGTQTLFHATRSNTTAIACGHAGYQSLKQKMRDQVNPGVSTDPLGLTPRFLIVPNELEDIAFQLTSSDRAIPSSTPGATDVPNIVKRDGVEAIVVDHLTDADDWYLVADPVDTDTIEIGFLDGREEPELLMQDDPRSGSVFTSDEVTWKIRHIYGGQVANYRAFQRGTQ